MTKAGKLGRWEDGRREALGNGLLAMGTAERMKRGGKTLGGWEEKGYRRWAMGTSENKES